MNTVFLTLAACLLYAVSAGFRSNYGIMLTAISENADFAYASVSFVLAVGQLVFGIMQPVFGVVALKRSNRFVLICGSVLMVVGMFLIPFCTAVWMLLFALGIILPAGTGAISFGIIMGTVTPRLGEKRAATASGLVNAASGIGSSALSPVIRALLVSYGLVGTTTILCIPILILLPVSFFAWQEHPRRKAGQSKGKKRKYVTSVYGSPAKPDIFIACDRLFCLWFSHGNYRNSSVFPIRIVWDFLFAFGICIFHLWRSRYGRLGYQRNRLHPCQNEQCPRVPVWLSSGLCRRIPACPKTPITVYVFSIALGLTSSATVTPTSGLVSRTFGSEKLGMLFGLIFFCHQIGSFFSALLGGVSVSLTESYGFIWAVDIVLCFIAAAASFKISETK